MAAYYSANQYYDDDDGDSISSDGGGDVHRDRSGGVRGAGGDTPYQYSEDSGGAHRALEPPHGDGDDGLLHLGSDGSDGPSPSFLGGHGHGVGGREDAVDFDDPRVAGLPRILLMGPRRAGKTSIQRVVFHKMSPHETLFRLEATQTLERAVVDHTPLCRFTIWDFPGDQYEYGYGAGAGGGGAGPGGAPDGPRAGAERGEEGYRDDRDEDPRGAAQPPPHAAQPPPPNTPGASYDEQIFAKATALIFVLDAQDEPYDHVLQSFTDTVTRAVRANPTLAVEVFVHKVDGELFLSDEAKYDCRRDVMQQVADELADAGLSHDAVPVSYHLTSIYDHSVFEAFSRVVQRLIPELPTLEGLLNVLVSACAMEKAYLFDVASKLYIATDASPVDMQSVELCSDMIDVVLDVSGIYGTGGGGTKAAAEPPAAEPPLPEEGGEDGGDAAAGGGGAGDDGARPPGAADGAGSPAPDAEDDELLGKLVGQSPPIPDADADDAALGAAGAAYDSASSSTIHLSNGMVLYLREVDTMLALVCLTRAENFRKKSLINYNIGCLKTALRALPQATQGGGLEEADGT